MENVFVKQLKYTRNLTEAVTHIFIKKFDNIYEVYKSRDSEAGKYITSNELVTYLNSGEKVVVLNEGGTRYLFVNFSL